MANQYRKLKQRIPRTRQNRAAARKRLSEKSPQSSIWRSKLSSALALMVLLSIGSIIISCGWISILFIIDPQRVAWLNNFLPSEAKINISETDIPKTLTEIKKSLKQQKLTTGEILALESHSSQNNQLPNIFLLPVFKERNKCRSDCQELVELRVYKKSKEIEFNLQKEPHYYQGQKIEINGLSQFFVEAPVGSNVSIAGNENKEVYLPLTEIKTFDKPKSLPGLWFDLQGKHKQGNQSIIYGQIVHYNPQLRSLENMLFWKNPNNKVPQWQQVTGSKTEELVIDQTVGLEPRLQLYQIQAGDLVKNSVFLQPIELKPRMNIYGYQQSLFLARNGLWTPANAWLISIQKEIKKPLSEYVQAQIDLIKLHSQITKTQADKNWASPSQTVLTALMDGRWEKGLDVLISSPDSGREIYNLLQADRGRLWNRTTVALRLNPQRRAVLAWAYLMLTVQRGESRANTWLESQPQINRATFTYLQDLLVKLNHEVKNTHPSQIIGRVKKITTVKYANWLPVDGKADIVVSDDQVLYQIDVSAFHNGKTWLIYPFTDLQLPKIQTSLFWIKTLGLGNDVNIQIAVWLPDGEQQVKTATIKAVQMQNGKLKLLVTGDPIGENKEGYVPHPPLAFTNTALEWVQPSPMSMEALAIANPEVVEDVIPKIWRALQQSGDITGSSFTWTEIEEKMKNWPVQMIDITRDGNPDLVLTISDSAIASFKNSPQLEKINTPRTIIFAETGEIIYNDFNRDNQQALTAIAKLNNDQSIALLVGSKDKYSVRRWSEINQRLE
ncbi:MAG: hypothetical protein F6K61_09275 [Sphaerospermopsis sp. SIO1G1]|nr:hypothetical protein [Sphaerospermopsis sp. SIO1G1]